MKNILFLIALLHFSYTQAQEPWVYENDYGKGTQILESYDGGTLLLAIEYWQQGNGKLIKLNNTGVVLWEHTISDNTETLTGIKLAESTDGSIYIGGLTFNYEEFLGDAFLLKLDACGDLIWF
jgi:outer membrane protein assembly factor BamB